MDDQKKKRISQLATQAGQAFGQRLLESILSGEWKESRRLCNVLQDPLRSEIALAMGDAQAEAEFSRGE